MLPVKKSSSGDLFYQDLLISSGYSNSSNEEWLLVIRPERLFAVEGSTSDSDQNIIFTGVIKEFVYQGETAFALVAISDEHNLSIRFSTDSSGSQNLMRPGDTLRLGLKRSEAIIIPQTST
jgi:hypothetical protein